MGGRKTTHFFVYRKGMPMLRVIDIASHQAGINVRNEDCDVVIVKATGGTSYVNPYWRE